jgi:hypothetical protein
VEQLFYWSIYLSQSNPSLGILQFEEQANFIVIGFYQCLKASAILQECDIHERADVDGYMIAPV